MVTPLWIIFGSSIIVDAIQLFQKYGTFNFGYQFWFLEFKIIIFTKLMLCNVVLKILYILLSILKDPWVYLLYTLV